MPRKRTMCPCGCLGTSVEGRYIHGHAPVAARFWPKVATVEGDGCWEWTAYREKRGYGCISYRGKSERAHRVAWMLATDAPIPDGLDVCHTCDNPGCVRNDDDGVYVVDDVEYPRRGHLFLAPAGGNIQDMWGKGRHRAATDLSAIRQSGDDHWTRRQPEAVARGDGHARSKLTAAIVREARRAFAAKEATALDLARRHGVAHQVMWRAIVGKTWKHLDP